MSLLHKYLYGIPFAPAAANSRRKRASFTVKKRKYQSWFPLAGHYASARKFGASLAREARQTSVLPSELKKVPSVPAMKNSRTCTEEMPQSGPNFPYLR